MIEFQRVHKAYKVGQREITALEPCNLQIEQGQIYGLIGHSGAGKSTLLRLLIDLKSRALVVF